jgi:uncharacterized damage-inducible protein DinB
VLLRREAKTRQTLLHARERASLHRTVARLRYDVPMNEGSADLTGEAERLLNEYLGKIEQCVGVLSREQIWWRPNPQSNSVGNILLHLCGNLSQWVLASLGDVPFERHRREEFKAAHGEDGAALLARLREVVSASRNVARDLPDEKLNRVFVIQGITRDGFGVLLHAVEHMAYHTGQIVYIAKQLVGERTEIEFYPHLK